MSHCLLIFRRLLRPPLTLPTSSVSMTTRTIPESRVNCCVCIVCLLIMTLKIGGHVPSQSAVRAALPARRARSCVP